MKLRWIDRLCAGILAVCFLLTAAAFVAESFFGMQLSPYVVKLFCSQETKWIIFRVIGILLLLTAAWWCLNVALYRTRKQDHAFVEQRTNDGELRVSVKAIEGLVRKSVARHDELELTHVKIGSDRSGLTISLRCNTAADISIPLAMDAMQKQLKEYILESTGLSVSEILVAVDDAEAKLDGGTYRLNDAVACTPANAAEEDAPDEAEEPEEAEDEEEQTEEPAVEEEAQEEEQPEVDAADDEPEDEAPVTADNEAESAEDDDIFTEEDPADEDEAGPGAEMLFEDDEPQEEPMEPADDPEEEKTMTNGLE